MHKQTNLIMQISFVRAYLTQEWRDGRNDPDKKRRFQTSLKKYLPHCVFFLAGEAGEAIFEYKIFRVQDFRVQDFSSTRNFRVQDFRVQDFSST